MEELVHIKLWELLELCKFVKVGGTHSINYSWEASKVFIILICESEVLFVKLVLLVKSDGQSI